MSKGMKEESGIMLDPNVIIYQKHLMVVEKDGVQREYYRDYEGEWEEYIFDGKIHTFKSVYHFSKLEKKFQENKSRIASDM